MKLEDATRLLPHFKVLEGSYSKLYDSTIKQVFIAYKDGNLAEAQYSDYKNKNTDGRLPLVTSGEYEYTIAALLENGDLASVKSIIIQGQIDELIQKAEKLDYLQYNGGDINADENRD